MKSAQDLIGSVRGIQQFAAVRAGIAKGQFFSSDDARENDVSLDLLVPGSNHPRYRCPNINIQFAKKKKKTFMYMYAQCGKAH